MDNIDDSENNAKISDSAYSNSCSNSQSRRSHSSKSTHSGSHSSGSSGYGGKQSTSGSSNPFSQPPKKDKDCKKKKQSQAESNTEVEAAAEEPCGASEPEPDIVMPLEEPKPKKVDEIPSLADQPAVVEIMDISTSAPDSPKDEGTMVLQSTGSLHYVTSRPISSGTTEGFSCVISMHDGVVMYTTSSLTTTLGFPKDLWIGRSFIDFVHPRDSTTFASQITNGLAVPKVVNGSPYKSHNTIVESTMVCRIRRYRSLGGGFGVKERAVTYMPFMLKLSFKNIADEEKITYLVIQATPFFSAFKLPSESVMKPKPFVIRHSAAGNLEYIDPESVPYLGYLPQDVKDMDALMLYHDEDLPYLREIYEKIVKEGNVPRSLQYRMKTQNGDFLKLETEWSSFINPWSKKLEFIIGKHFIIEGPNNPDVFQSPEYCKPTKKSEEDRNRAQGLRDSIIKILTEVLTKPAEMAKQCLSKRCQDLAVIMENLIAEQPKNDYDLRIEFHEPDNSYYERDSVMLGGISPHHEYNDSKSSTETPLSYNQLNYHENLQRYFDSHQPDSYEYNTYQIVGLHETSKARTTKCMSPVAQDSGDSFDMSSCASSKSLKLEPSISPTIVPGDYNHIRLTEHALHKHNTEMEKELVKLRRETRSSTKGDREKASNESRQKKKEHLARCNASFQPTLAGQPSEFMPPYQPHGTKRTMPEVETIKSCPIRKSRRRRTASPPDPLPNHHNHSHNHNVTTTVASGPRWSNSAENSSTFILGVGVPPHVPIMRPVPAVHRVIPMYYTPAVGQAGVTTTNTTHHMPSTSHHHHHQPFQAPMPCVMYGHQVYGQPFVYSPINAHITYPTPPQMGHSVHYSGTLNPLSLASKNYEEVETERQEIKKTVRRKMDPPWMKQVCVSSELIYKYQVVTKSMDEVLESDKKKMATIQQPSLVNEQLEQLYLDLQLEGVAARLTLEEGITSSSSSGEDSPNRKPTHRRRKKEHSKLVMIYEEDASLPSPMGTEPEENVMNTVL